MKFEIGDKVKVIYTGSFINRKYSKLGDILTIRDFHKYNESLYQNYINFTNGDRIGFNGEDSGLELVQETYTLKECAEQKLAIWCDTHEKFFKVYEKITNSAAKIDQWNLVLGDYNVVLPGYYNKVTWNWNKSDVSKFVGTEGRKIIDFEQVKFEDMKKITGYKLINKYPQRNIGDLCNYIPKINNTNFIWNDDKTVIPRDFQPDVTPDWFEPVYEEKKPITIYKDKIEIVISDKIVANGTVVDIKELKDLLLYTPDEGYFYNKLGKTWNVNPILDLKGFKLGCTTFKIDELKNIVKQFETWNK